MHIDQMLHAAEAESFLKKFANANRLMALVHLLSGEKTVGELARAVGLSQSALSQHLATMREAGLVGSDKRGLMVWYRICSPEAEALLAVLGLIYCGALYSHPGKKVPRRCRPCRRNV